MAVDRLRKSAHFRSMKRKVTARKKVDCQVLQKFYGRERLSKAFLGPMSVVLMLIFASINDNHQDEKGFFLYIWSARVYALTPWEFQKRDLGSRWSRNKTPRPNELCGTT